MDKWKKIALVITNDTMTIYLTYRQKNINYLT